MGFCTQCKNEITGINAEYINGPICLCGRCFSEYSETHKVLTKYLPGGTQQVSKNLFYDWVDLRTFLEDHPGKKWLWYDMRIIQRSSKGHIEDHWYTRDESIMKEVRKKFRKYRWYHAYNLHLGKRRM